MNNQQNWTRKVWQGLLLLLAIAIGARVVYGLLVPLVPLLGSALVLLAVYALFFRSRR